MIVIFLLLGVGILIYALQRLLKSRDEAKTNARWRAEIIGAYGPEIAEKIFDHNVWVGMSADHLRLSWGPPSDIEQTRTRKLVRETWKYNQVGVNRFEDRIFIENDEVSGWKGLNVINATVAAPEQFIQVDQSSICDERREARQLSAVRDQRQQRDDPAAIIDSTTEWRVLSGLIPDNDEKSDIRSSVMTALNDKVPLPHLLIVGGTSDLQRAIVSSIVRQLGVKCQDASNAQLTSPERLASCLANLEDRDVLFLQDLQLSDAGNADILYGAITDCEMDLILGEGADARNVRVSLAAFTAVCAVSSESQMSLRLRDRFGLRCHLVKGD